MFLPLLVNKALCVAWLSLGRPLATLRCVMYFRFCGWRHVST